MSYAERSGLEQIYRDELVEALQQEELQGLQEGASTPEAEEAAFRLAVALGKCQLFGIHTEHDGILPAAVAVAAAKGMVQELTDALEEATTLEERWEAALDSEPREAEELVFDLLEQRMDLWAAWIALSEAEDDARASGAMPPESAEVPTAPRFSGSEHTADLTAWIDRIMELTDELDRILQQPENITLLATAAETELLRNWRALLAEPYCDLLPWWLDGTLEEVAQAALGAGSHRRAPVPEAAPGPSGPGAIGTPSASLILPGWTAALAAAAPIGSAPVTLKWTAPDGRWCAYLILPESRPAELVVRFYDASGYEARALVGEKVFLSDVPGVIAEDACAIFSTDAIEQAGGHPRLCVGAAQEEWHRE